MSKRSVKNDPKLGAPVSPVSKPVLQRKCACGNQASSGGECAECQKKNQALQRKTSEPEKPSTHGAAIPPIVDEVLTSSGQPLDASTRAFMEPRFEHDFSQVRVHTDARAGESAEAVNAQAYTVGRDLVFAPGQYQPTTEAGNAVLAHELSHVLQQEGTSGQSAKALSHPADSSEREADSVAGSVLRNEPVAVNQSPSATMQALSVEEGLGIGGAIVAGTTVLGAIGVGIAALAGAFDKTVFSDDDLKAYLKTLATTGKIEGHRDSDNKARDIVRRWEKKETGYDINAGFKDGEAKLSASDLKFLLIDEMITGVVGDDDEQAILKILKAESKEERYKLAERIGYERLYDKFDGKELDELDLLLPQLASFHPHGGEQSKAYTIYQYIEKWERDHGTTITPAEKSTLARGCIGITALNLYTLGLPDLSNCYDSFAQVWEAQKKMNAFLQENFPDRKALIFSKRFYSGGKDYKPDPKTGKVDMSEYDYEARGPGYTNYDYGLYDEETGKWWHANHCDTTLRRNPKCGGPMEVYESNLVYYSQTLGDFDRQVFCVGVATP
ncbi:MAG TPA: DUF4157 domain-containing protein [Pyrinomonadaceae bacterium]|nr:DUF4157 domain-containing protein [Pyrinomonadaceae bacterium]